MSCIFFEVSFDEHQLNNFWNKRYCLSRSPVPVIVVRPGRKLRKAVEKRRADPKRATSTHSAFSLKKEAER